MKNIILVLFIITAVTTSTIAQDVKPETTAKQFMQINTVESVIAGGLGRS